MDWILNYQLYLFDLDGLLVNTEEIHFEAYRKMLKDRGFQLPWDFAKYFSIAQQDAEAPKRYIYAEFPALQKEEPDWSVLYAEKKKCYQELLEQMEAPLMPGAADFLEKLENKKKVVVTHSALCFVEALRRKNPRLNLIEHWITREDYTHPKPAPDGYLKAIELFAKPGDAIIGFEDSSRGLRALLQTPATPILINPFDDALKSAYKEQGVRVYSAFKELL